jgi:hypothetical protein
MLSKKQVHDVCLLTSNADITDMCRHCDYDYATNQYNCVKLTNKTSAISRHFPLGDNCKGYPFLPHIKQGWYDIC